MKHQLFKKGTYVQFNGDYDFPLTADIIGKVKDSTLVKHRLLNNDIFNFPELCIELEMNLLVVFEEPGISPMHIVGKDEIWIYLLENDFNGMKIIEDKLFVTPYLLTMPGEEYKKLFYEINTRAK